MLALFGKASVAFVPASSHLGRATGLLLGEGQRRQGRAGCGDWGGTRGGQGLMRGCGVAHVMGNGGSSVRHMRWSRAHQQRENSWFSTLVSIRIRSGTNISISPRSKFLTCQRTFSPGYQLGLNPGS
jgi:hypothetical protein